MSRLLLTKISYQEQIRFHTKGREDFTPRKLRFHAKRKKAPLKIGNKFETYLLCMLCEFVNFLQKNYQKLPQICSTNFGGFGTLWCGTARVCPIKTSPDTVYNFQHPVPEHSSTLVCKVPLCVCAIKSQCTQCKSEVPVCVCH